MTDKLIEGIYADYLLADRGYDIDGVIEQASNAKMENMIFTEEKFSKDVLSLHALPLTACSVPLIT